MLEKSWAKYFADEIFPKIGEKPYAENGDKQGGCLRNSTCIWKWIRQKQDDMVEYNSQFNRKSTETILLVFIFNFVPFKRFKEWEYVGFTISFIWAYCEIQIDTFFGGL